MKLTITVLSLKCWVHTAAIDSNSDIDAKLHIKIIMVGNVGHRKQELLHGCFDLDLLQCNLCVTSTFAVMSGKSSAFSTFAHWRLSVSSFSILSLPPVHISPS